LLWLLSKASKNRIRLLTAGSSIFTAPVANSRGVITAWASLVPRLSAPTLKVMFSRKLNEYEALLGMSEAVSHLHFLMGQGRIIREADENGVWRYWSTGRRADAA